MQYVFAFITKRYIAGRQVFAVIAVNLTYLIIVIVAYWKTVSECLFLAYVVGLNIGSSASK